MLQEMGVTSLVVCLVQGTGPDVQIEPHPVGGFVVVHQHVTKAVLQRTEEHIRIRPQIALVMGPPPVQALVGRLDGYPRPIKVGAPRQQEQNDNDEGKPLDKKCGFRFHSFHLLPWSAGTISAPVLRLIGPERDAARVYQRPAGPAILTMIII
jgi:hypothetical protein